MQDGKCNIRERRSQEEEKAIRQSREEAEEERAIRPSRTNERRRKRRRWKIQVSALQAQEVLLLTFIIDAREATS